MLQDVDPARRRHDGRRSPWCASTAGTTRTWGKRNVSVHGKFGYDHAPDELTEWQPRIAELASEARDVHGFKNICDRSYAQQKREHLADILSRENMGAPDARMN